LGLGEALIPIVRFTTKSRAVQRRSDPRLHYALPRRGRLDFLCLDELRYLHLDRRGAELLFQVLTERDERASVAVAGNAPFREWGQTFSDPRLSAAVVDRLTFRARILETGAASYRLRTSQASARRDRHRPDQRPIEAHEIGRGWVQF